MRAPASDWLVGYSELSPNGDLGSETGEDRKCEGRDSVRVVAQTEVGHKRRYGKFHGNFP